MDDDKKIKFIWIIIGILCIVIIIAMPFCIDYFIVGNQVKSNIENSDWISFLGSYLGGIMGSMISGVLAAFGVFYTITYYKKQEKRSAATGVKPALNVWQLNGSITNGDLYLQSVRRFDYVLENGTFIKWIGFSGRKEGFNRNEWMTVDFVIENIGNGAVVQLKTELKIDNEIKGCSFQTINIQKDSSVMYGIFIEKKDLIGDDYEFVFQYTDIYGSNKFEQALNFRLCDNKDFADMEEISLPKTI